MSAVLDHVMLVGTGAITGFLLVHMLLLVRLGIDALAAGEQDQPVIWPDPRSLTVWTGEDWFTVTVMPVAFGRWGVAACQDEVPRRPEPLELVTRARTEEEARGRARELIGHALAGASPERGALLAAR